MFNIQEELKKLPENPGVYLMKNSDGFIIYVGKAISLKNRVRQYFQSSSNHSPKVLAMVSKIAYFEIIVTDSEMEALILECNLIKKYKPYYNILLKDDKNFPYIKITMGEDYPRVLFSRRIEKDGSKYFGPYTSAFTVRNMIDLLKKLFPIKTCSKNVGFGKKGRPCLNYHIGQCMGVCSGTVKPEEYRVVIKGVIDFLNGNNQALLKQLNEKMEEAAENLQFERAKEIRDHINSVKLIAEKQKVFSTSMEDQDVIAFASNDFNSCIQMFFIRNGMLLGKENFMIEGHEEPGEAIASFIKQYYSQGVFIPSTILLKEEPEDLGVLEGWLSGLREGRVYLKCPERGQKYQLMEMAEKNAYLMLEQHSRRLEAEKGWIDDSLTKVANMLGHSKSPRRIEAYDISNTGSENIVASMVVFENGRKQPSKYKRFKIKSVEVQNDYQSMQEAIFRRLTHGIREAKAMKENNMKKQDFSDFPDIILVDGGIGHVSAALEITKQLGVEIPIVGMVKDDKHRTRGLVVEGNVFEIKDDLNLLRFITSIQDEAHRFALDYNKKLRANKSRASELDNIEGIGESRKLLLLKHFKSISSIKNAEIESLVDVKGLGRKAAEAVYNYFH